MSLRAKKTLGQNFLNAPGVVRKMIDYSMVKPNDIVVEVGPGKGVLTGELLNRGAQVIAFELDPRMVEYLEGLFSSSIESGKLKLVTADILSIAIDDYLDESCTYKVIANIPYYITSPILRFFLENKHQPSLLCLLVQHELAVRIARDPKESILSLSVKAYGTPRYLIKVPRRYFSPQPKVDSAVLVVDGIHHGLFLNEEHRRSFFDLVKQGFLHKRKVLASNLSELSGNKPLWQSKLVTLGYTDHVRAEELHLDDWLTLSTP